MDLDAWLAAVRDGVAEAVPRAGAFAQHVGVRTTTGSTNDDVARAALEGAPEGYTVIAAEQTAGRGRRGASWHSPAAHGLYLSTLLRPDRWAAVRADAASPVSSLVTLMAGVAVVSAIGDICEAPVELKWPNDVMVRTPRESGVGSRESVMRRASEGHGGATVGPVLRTRPDGAELSAFALGASARHGGPSQGSGPPWRKLAGILAEGASDGGVLRSVVVGIGVNLQHSDAPPAVAARMIALDQLLPAGHRAPDLLRTLVAALLVRLREGAALLARGDIDEVRERWRQRAPSVGGTRVRWQVQGVVHEGDAVGIDDSGALRVRADGIERLVHGGDVAWLLEPLDA